MTHQIKSLHFQTWQSKGVCVLLTIVLFLLLSPVLLPSSPYILDLPDTTGYRFDCGLLHLLVELPFLTLKYEASG